MKKLLTLVAVLIFISGCKKDETTTVSHPYGSGNGKFMIYFPQDCNHGTLSVYIDGAYSGSIGYSFPNGAPDCDNSYTFSKVLPAGTHHFKGTFSGYSGSYNSDFTVVADQCSSNPLNC